MNASARKALGAAAIVVFLVVYIGAAVRVGEWLQGDAWLLMLFYVVAGIAWVIPLRPLFAWMHPREDAQTKDR